mmetsp:Transcript_147780/g.474365  ORF Transcript_147780/g.474365 Transcript_147780/m.474365 type:complete len:316 (+) Transcript_147780:3836-4783(+)
MPGAHAEPPRGRDQGRCQRRRAAGLDGRGGVLEGAASRQRHEVAQVPGQACLRRGPGHRCRVPELTLTGVAACQGEQQAAGDPEEDRARAREARGFAAQSAQRTTLEQARDDVQGNSQGAHDLPQRALLGPRARAGPARRPLRRQRRHRAARLRAGGAALHAARLHHRPVRPGSGRKREALRGGPPAALREARADEVARRAGAAGPRRHAFRHRRGGPPCRGRLAGSAPGHGRAEQGRPRAPEKRRRVETPRRHRPHAEAGPQPRGGPRGNRGLQRRGLRGHRSADPARRHVRHRVPHPGQEQRGFPHRDGKSAG